MPQALSLVSVFAAAWVAADAAPDGGERQRLPRSINELAADVPYAAIDALGLGFSSREIAPKTFIVTVNGDAATPLSRLVAIAFARAAEIGLERNWPSFRTTDLKRTAECVAWNGEPGAEAGIFAGRPKLAITVVYDPASADADIRRSADTFDEMRKRISQAQASEREKQATVDWVLEYCASTGITGARATENGE